MAISLTHSRGGSCAANEWTEEFWNVMSSVLIGERLEHDFWRINQIEILSTKWAPTRHKWSYNPYKWPYKWLTGVITPLRGVINLLIIGSGKPLRTRRPSMPSSMLALMIGRLLVLVTSFNGNCCWQIQNSPDNLRWLLFKIMDTFEVSTLVTTSFTYCLNQPYHILYNRHFFTVFLEKLLKIKSFWALKRCN